MRSISNIARRIARRARVGAGLAAALALVACAGSGGKGGSGGDCNPLVGALVGGAVGAALGSDRHKGAAAAIGAGVGAMACVAYNYKTRQTRSAEQVSDDYLRRNPALPPTPTVTAYRTESTRPSAAGGEDVTVTSNIEVVPGTREPLRELREEFAVLDPDGVERSHIVKVPAPAGSKGGAYVSTLQFTFPKGVPAGAYQVQSRLFVNGQQATTSAVKIQVAGVAFTPRPASAPSLLMVARLAVPLTGAAGHTGW
jgi:hypothetical protein